MVDISGKKDTPGSVEVTRYNVGFLHLLPSKYGPASVFYHKESEIVILVVHAFEAEDMKLIATKDPNKIGMTRYYFYRSHGLKDGHPVFEEDLLRLIDWDNCGCCCGRKPTTTEISHELFSIAHESVYLQEKLDAFLKENDYVSPHR